jgi:TonB family protein
MKNKFSSPVAWILTVGLFSLLSFADDSQLQKDGSELLTKAAALQGIRMNGAKPFLLHARLHAERIVPKPTDGQYEELWIAPDKWRRETAFPGYKQVEVGDADSRWLSRNTEYRPRPVYLTQIAIEAFVDLKLLPEERITSIHNRKKKGIESKCLELTTPKPGSPRELCFDTSGALIAEEYLGIRFQYADFANFGDKIFPRSIQVDESGREVLNLKTDDLTSPANPRSELFRHDSSARQLALCERWPTQPITKVPPRYPPEARSAHEEGTVVVYALLSGEGYVEKTAVIESAGRALDQATLDAVQHWTYPPAKCGARSLGTEIEIRVNYSISTY